eukprot:TRINITY_DN60002_c0_g1_i1.p1 TRINITY_DN60002_c0_g1~~TRINITY_DN60002_c0_g1_i1.p1  ORF type:complete len:375 (+),score=129.64 TRINITY_DN60002_c0_g1_i1:74-1126(+)
MEVGARLSFVVNYDDPQAGVTRQYQLLYHTQDDTIEMHDIKNRRIFLKRCSYPQVAPSDLYIGATVTVHARRLTVVAYADDATQRIYAHKSATTVFIITPEGYERMGHVLRHAFVSGFRVKRMNMLRLSDSEAAELRQIDHTAGAWEGHPLVVVEIAGDDALAAWQRVAESDPVAGATWSPAGDESARQIMSFFFESPVRRNRSSATLQNCTLCVIKPHAVREGHGGEILQSILDEGFEISALRLIHLTKMDAEDFLEVYKGVVPEYAAIVEQLSAAPVWVAEIRAEGAVDAFRQMCGPHDPEIAKVLRPQSLRSRFGRTRQCNAVHCTDLAEDGVLECDFFFDLVKPQA